MPGQKPVEQYLAQLGTAGWEDAYHSLVERGPDVLDELESAFRRCADPILRAAIVEIASSQGSDLALPILQEALADERRPVWSAAIEGLISIAGPTALKVLECARRAAGHRRDAAVFAEAVDEALDQVRRAASRRDQ
jgi:HEAT repeat protein